jgi:hypothetical protein
MARRHNHQRMWSSPRAKPEAVLSHCYQSRRLPTNLSSGHNPIPSPTHAARLLPNCGCASSFGGCTEGCGGLHGGAPPTQTHVSAPTPAARCTRAAPLTHIMHLQRLANLMRTPHRHVLRQHNVHLHQPGLRAVRVRPAPCEHEHVARQPAAGGVGRGLGEHRVCRWVWDTVHCWPCAPAPEVRVQRQVLCSASDASNPSYFASDTLRRRAIT